MKNIGLNKPVQADMAFHSSAKPNQNHPSYAVVTC
jgi:hypothetical protein